MKENLIKKYGGNLISPEKAASMVRSHDRVYVGIASSVAYTMADALWERRSELEDVVIISALMLRNTKLHEEKEESPFRIVTPFIGGSERYAQKVGRPLTFTSLHLSQFDYWFHEIGKPTIAFLEVSLPDDDGMVSFGPTGSCINRYILDTADYVVLEVNRNVPYITGDDALMNLEDADAVIMSDNPMPVLSDGEPDEEMRIISRHIAEQVPDGATIQLGIGKLSTAVGYELRTKNDLGIHTELFSTPMMDLIRSGNVTNKKKGFMDGKSVFAFSMGTEEMYRFMDHNETLYCGMFPFVNDARNIAKNKNMISINSAMAIDVFGQVAADSLGYRQQSATGGQLDFVRGAQWSEGGKSFIAMASSFIKNGERKSKIMFSLPEGTAITTPRSDVQYVVTEYGCVDLHPLTMDDRVRAVISLAHPSFRDELYDQAKEKHLI